MMKRAILFLSCMLLAGACDTTPPTSPLPKTNTVIWAGLDYSMVRMYGTEDFKDPAAIFPDYFDKWNALFLQERINTLGAVTGKKVVPDTEHIAERNKLATTNQVIRQDGDFAARTSLPRTSLTRCVPTSCPKRAASVWFSSWTGSSRARRAAQFMSCTLMSPPAMCCSNT